VKAATDDKNNPTHGKFRKIVGILIVGILSDVNQGKDSGGYAAKGVSSSAEG
jgi:hypothetical protein